MVEHCYLLLLLLVALEAKPVSSWRWRHARCAHMSDGKCTIVAFASLDRKHVRRPPHCNSRNSMIVAAVAAGRGDDDHDQHSSNEMTKPRQMVIFRAPSRHTYGFVSNSNHYDLPILELRNLLSSMTACDNHDIHLIPVDSSSQQTLPREEEENQTKTQKPKSKNQSKKKGAKYPHHVQSLYWIECINEISPHDISKAASRAILTHATFSIQESISFSDEDWNGCNFSAGNRPCSEIVEQMEMIDMANPNMSRDARSELIERVSCLIEMQNPELQIRLQKCFPIQSSSDDMESVLIHHCITPTQQQLQLHNRQPTPTHHHEQKCIHHLYFGCRTSIGPAGTKGAPSHTLRRTHRGLLKEYALKNRRVAANNADAGMAASERSNTSTAMEPEIGFLMSNLALAGIINPKGSRVLDPCCGSGSLLLYAAALGAKKLVGVDSDGSVWKDVECEFQRHLCAIDGGSSPLAVPTFFHGDVQTPSMTDVLCSPNSFDAIVCDPPYNIGAPVLIDGKDVRPRNYHDKNDDTGDDADDSGSIFNKSMESSPVSTNLVSHILAIARRVLVNGGRVVLFLPVRKEEMSMPLEELLLSRGCKQWEVCGEDEKDSESSLILLKSISRLQYFSPTFSRWLVCMEKRPIK